MSGSLLRSARLNGLYTQLAVCLIAVPLLVSVTLFAAKGRGSDSAMLVGYPPIIEVTKPPDGSTRHSQNTEIRLDYWPDPDCVDEGEGEGEGGDRCEPDESTLQVWVNSVEKTSQFTKHGGWANSTSVTMPDNQWSTIRGKICNGFGCDEDTAQVYIETEPALEVSLLPTDDQVRDRGLCQPILAGPSAWVCDEFVIQHSTVPYYSLGKARGVTLVYASALAVPHVLIHADVIFPWESTVPDNFSTRLWRNGSFRGDEIFFSTSGISTADSADVRRVTLNLNMGGTAVGRHAVKFVAWSDYGEHREEGFDSIGFAYDTVVATKIHRGWGIPGLARVVPDGQNLMWSDGIGTTHYYLAATGKAFFSIEGVLAEMAVVDQDSSAEKTWKRTLPDGAVEYYNVSGQLSRIEGVNPADTTKFTYSVGLISEITDATGQKIEFNYNGSGGRLSEIIYPGGGASERDTTKLEYDANNRLYRIYDPDGLYTEFSYWGTGKKIKEQRDRSGAITKYRWYYWKYAHRVERVVLATGSDSLVYAAPQLAALPDTTQGGLSASNPADTPPKRSDVSGTIRNPRGNTSTFKVNEFGGLLEWIDPLNRKVSYERDANSLVTRRVDPDSSEYVWERDSLGMVRRVSDVSSDTTILWTYNCTGYPCRPSKMIRYRGPGLPADTVLYYYTGNRLFKAVRPNGSSTIYSYSGAFSQLSEVKDPSGHRRKYEYNETTGHLLRSFQECGAAEWDTVRYWYDGKGRKIKQTQDPTDVEVYREWEYDMLNRVAAARAVEEIEEAEIHTVTFSYDDANRKVTVTDPMNQSQVFTYDALGRQTRHDDPANAYETFAYDGNGNVTSWVTRRGDTLTYTYDALNRMISKTVPGVGTTTYGYQALRGTLDTIYAPNAKNIRSFDSRGRILLDSSWVAGISGGWRAVRYSYDAQGNLKTLTDPWGVEWTYDPTPQAHAYGSGLWYLSQTWVDAFHDTTTWYYDADGLLAKVSYANGQQDTVVWDWRHRIVEVGDVGYARGSRTRGARGGRIHEMTVSNPTDDRLVRYKYDFKGQLIEEWDSIAPAAPVIRTFEYDSAGNRTATGYKYDDNYRNRLLATPTDTLTYDASSNLTWWKDKSTGHYKTFTWDAENRLIQVKLYNSQSINYRTVTFTYDGLGRRVKKLVTEHSTSEADTVRYVWDGSEVLATLSGSGDWIRRYTPDPTRVDRTISVRTSSDSCYYFHHDAVGNVVSVTNVTGDTVSRYRYEAFGKHTSIGSEGYASSVLWQGREYDSETGLYYFRARYYAPSIGRFLSEDPIGATAAKNLFLFAGNDPVNSTDPWGLWSLTCKPVDGNVECYDNEGELVGGCYGTEDVEDCKDKLLDLLEEQLRITIHVGELLGVQGNLTLIFGGGFKFAFDLHFGFGGSSFIGGMMTVGAVTNYDPGGTSLGTAFGGGYGGAVEWSRNTHGEEYSGVGFGAGGGIIWGPSVRGTFGRREVWIN